MASRPVVEPKRLPEEVSNAAIRGWHILPVKAQGKTPLVQDWQKAATSDTIQLETWSYQWPECNWGIATGKHSGVFVLDIDGEQGLDALGDLKRQGYEIPDTLAVSTGRGSHLYFRWPEGQTIRNSAGKIAPGLDIRGDGGFVVIPPSNHSSGIQYAYIDSEEPIADPPRWLLRLLEKQPARPVRVASTAAEQSIGPGQREPLLFSTACKLRSQGVGMAGIEAALQALNKTFVTPHDEAKVQQIAAKSQRYASGRPPGALFPDLVCLEDVESRPVPWIWRGYLAYGMLAMLSGDPDAGKTFLALAIAADLSNGRVPVSGDACTPIATLYLSRENSAEYVLKPRFDALAGDAAQFHLLKGSVLNNGEEVTRSGVTLKEIDVLEKALQQTGAKLIVIDPIQSYLGANVDAHRSNETRPVLDGLIGLAEKYKACVLLIRHLSKSSGGRAIHRGLGSIDLTGAVRMEMIAGNAAGDPDSHALVQIKNNVGPHAPSLGYEIVGEEMDARLEWRGSSDMTAHDLLAPDVEAERKSDVVDATDFLREKLSDGPKSCKKLEAECGLHLRTLQRAAQRMGLKKTRDGECGQWIWSLS